VKRADRPDSVHRRPVARPAAWPPFLWAGGRPPGSVPPTRQLMRSHMSDERGRRPRPLTLAYLVLLRAEIARFTRRGCPCRLVSVAL